MLQISDENGKNRIKPRSLLCFWAKDYLLFFISGIAFMQGSLYRTPRCLLETLHLYLACGICGRDRTDCFKPRVSSRESFEP